MHLSEAEMACTLAVARLKVAGDAEEIERQFAILREAADAGYAPAQYAYAYWLDMIRADSLGGIPCLIQAARQGHIDARDELCRRYVGQKKVRALVGECLGADEIAALGLTEGNWFTRLFIPNETGNRPVAMLLGLLVLGVMGAHLFSFIISWYESSLLVEELSVDALGVLSVFVGAFLFVLCAIVGVFLEFREAGSGADHPLAFVVGFLFVGYLTFVLLAWGWYGFFHAPREGEYWWLPAVICTVLGLLAALLLRKTLAYFLRVQQSGRR